jgi:DNA-binding beta-propeller fold protein YncE
VQTESVPSDQSPGQVDQDNAAEEPIEGEKLVERATLSRSRSGLLTFGDWGKVMILFWTIQILFFTTFFTNVKDGLATGIVGSLGYWLAQQEVARGGQPWYYYYMLGGLYEFLPILLSLAGIAAIVYWLIRDRQWDPVPSLDRPDVVDREIAGLGGTSQVEVTSLTDRYRGNRIYFVAFLIWWMLGSWATYTIAGEKMPWLMTHLTLPMTVLGGWMLSRVIYAVDWRRASRTHAVWLIGVTPALLFGLILLFGNPPAFGREVQNIASITEWLVALVIVAGLTAAIWYWGKQGGWANAVRLLGIGGVALLFLLTIRFSYMLNYINYDMATEYLVYAHATPDVKRALNEIDLISERTVGERNVVVAYDDDTSWPMSWYMRLYPNAHFYGASPNSDSMSAPVIIVGPKNYDAVHPYVVRDYVKRSYRLIWWPDQGYFGWTPQRMLETLRDPQKMEDLLQVIFYRRYPGAEGESEWRDLTEWPNRHEFEMWVRRDIAADIWDLGVVPVAATDGTEANIPETDLSATATYSDVYDGLSLLNPRALAVGADGRRYIADTDNHRVVVLDAGGGFVSAFGSYCQLAEGESSGCVDPDGSGPGEIGDGQFYEPWGIAVDDSGTIYVADTWNGRIQALDIDGNLLHKWGQFSSTSGELGDAYAMFGPRGLTVDGGGNLLVADTGNKRILHFTPDGTLLKQIGGGGVIAGRFEEPTDVAVDPVDGSVYVADAWNRRIQKFAPDLSFVAEWPVASWESQDRLHKPYLTVTSSGDVYASDPAMYRVLVYGADGTLKTSFGRFGVEEDRFGLPNGLATDPLTNDVLVADGGNSRVMVFQAIP